MRSRDARVPPLKPPPCPCGHIVGYEACCARLHLGLPAPDAEALMRSRYAAYVLGLRDYLLATWHPDTRPDALDLDDAAGQRTAWLGLDVIARTQAGETATVEFVARFRAGGGRAQRLHEQSRFQRVDGRWLYVDGDVLQRARSVLRR